MAGSGEATRKNKMATQPDGNIKIRPLSRWGLGLIPSGLEAYSFRLRLVFWDPSACWIYKRPLVFPSVNGEPHLPTLSFGLLRGVSRRSWAIPAILPTCIFNSYDWAMMDAPGNLATASDTVIWPSLESSYIHFRSELWDAWRLPVLY